MIQYLGNLQNEKEARSFPARTNKTLTKLGVQKQAKPYNVTYNTYLLPGDSSEESIDIVLLYIR